MTPTTIRIPISQKIYLGDYETINPTVEVTATLDPGENPDVAFGQAHHLAQSLWAQEAILSLKAAIARRAATGLKTDLAEAILDHIIAQV